MAPTMRKESLTGQLIGVHVAMISLATVTVVSRLMVRWTLTDSGFGGDDIVIIISLLLAGVFVAINLDRMWRPFFADQALLCFANVKAWISNSRCEC